MEFIRDSLIYPFQLILDLKSNKKLTWEDKLLNKEPIWEKIIGKIGFISFGSLKSEEK